MLYQLSYTPPGNGQRAGRRQPAGAHGLRLSARCISDAGLRQAAPQREPNRFDGILEAQPGIRVTSVTTVVKSSSGKVVTDRTG